MAPHQTRRRLLLATGATLAGLAGCLSSGSPIANGAQESACRITVRTNANADERPEGETPADVTDAASAESDGQVTEYVGSVAVIRDEGWATLRIGLTEGGANELDRLQVMGPDTVIPVGGQRSYELSIGHLPYHGRIVLIPWLDDSQRVLDQQVVIEFNCPKRLYDGALSRSTQR